MVVPSPHLQVPLILAVLGLSGPAGAAEPAAPPAEPRATHDERVEVREVLLEVVVTDRAGTPVLGLDSGDFLVHENGEAADVIAVSYRSYRALRLADPTPGPAASRSVPRRAALQSASANRYFILLFHDLLFLSDRSTLGVLSHRTRAARDARRWLVDELEPNDFVAVAVYDSKLEIHQDFTNDIDAVTAALGRVMARRHALELGPVDPAAPSLLHHLPAGRQRLRETTTVRQGLKALARAAGTIPGRKHLLYFGIGNGLSGFDRGLFDSRFTPTLLETLNDNQLVAYTLDLTPPNVEHALSWTLDDFAEKTGGTYFNHIDSFRKPLRSIARQLAGAYLLSYESRFPSGIVGYNKIDVTTRNPSLRVSTRRGFLYGDLP